MWNVSQLEIAVHEPIPAGEREVVASWGWPTEYPSWTWDAPLGTKFSVNVYRSVAVPVRSTSAKLCMMSGQSSSPVMHDACEDLGQN